jgi:alpha-L-rhamnosidase
VSQTSSGRVHPAKTPKLRWSREWSGPRPEFKAFPADSSTLYPSHELEALDSVVRSRRLEVYCPTEELTLKPDHFRVFDLGGNLTGFIGLKVVCDQPVDLYLAFDELAMEDGDVSLVRYHCANVVKYSLKPGVYDLETLEPYTLKYLKVIALNGACRVSGIYLREYACPDAYRGSFAASDPQLGARFAILVIARCC